MDWVEGAVEGLWGGGYNLGGGTARQLEEFEGVCCLDS